MKKIALLLPAYNEAKVLAWSIENLKKIAQKNLSEYIWKLVVVDNASTDETSAVVSGLQKQYQNLDYYRLPIKGRGYALRQAWLNLDFDIALYMDVDLAVALDAVKPTIDAVAKQGADIAIGSRYAKGAKVERSLGRSITSIGYNILTKLIIGLKAKDAQCGFKAIKKTLAIKLLPLIKDNNWFFDTELLFLAERKKLKIIEIPVTWVETRPGARKSKVKVFKTIIDYIFSLIGLRWRSLTGRLL
ncbi:glycosyltransferase [Candidatus Parcubacteria bacterium]|jgi:glycosyltransferase involved in cell wall biosynthesis|nr:MAG: glycosyltransferase [Candidatus Parcubacteria bacterium]